MGQLVVFGFGSHWLRKLSGARLANQGSISRKSRKLFGPEKPFLKLRSVYSKRLIFYYDFQIPKDKFVAKCHAWKRLRFTKEIMSPEMRPKSFEKRAPVPDRIK